MADGLAGVECLSGIPGRVGATPIQNVGAYGQDVSETIVEVRAYDRQARACVTLDRDACRFTYRHSVFKGSDRYVVLDVTYALRETEESQPIAYAELARRLGVRPGERVSLKEARDAVLELRRGKGMVLDAADPDSRSAGSFFTNPILTPDQLAALERRVAERLGPDAAFPRYPEPDGRTKTSAAWLIDKAGFAKGHARGPVRVDLGHVVRRGGGGCGDCEPNGCRPGCANLGAGRAGACRPRQDSRDCGLRFGLPRRGRLRRLARLVLPQPRFFYAYLAQPQALQRIDARRRPGGHHALPPGGATSRRSTNASSRPPAAG